MSTEKKHTEKTVASSIHRTIMEFIDDIKNNIFTKPSEQGDLLLVEFFFGKLDHQSAANHVIAHVLPQKKNIRTRNVEFFYEKRKEIFAGLPEDKIEYFSHLVRTSEREGGLSTDDRNAVWAYFDTLVALGELYKKHK